MLQLAVNHVLPNFLKSHDNVTLVVIDSVAFHFRHDFEDMGQRTRVLTAYAQSLTAIARDYNLAVVIINQVRQDSPVQRLPVTIVQGLPPQYDYCQSRQVTTKIDNRPSAGASFDGSRATEIGMQTDTSTPIFSGIGSGSGALSERGVLVPALGPSWAHACATRCMLYWDAGERYARLIKSPTQPDQARPHKSSCVSTDFMARTV